MIGAILTSSQGPQSRPQRREKNESNKESLLVAQCEVTSRLLNM